MDTFTDIRIWASDRNLIRGATPHSQFLKIMSEFGELADGISKNNLDLVKDGIGDTVVVATIIAAQTGTVLVPPVVTEPMTTRRDDRKTYVETLYNDCASVLGEIGRFIHLHDYDRLGKNIHALFTMLADIAALYELTFEQCVRHAYEEIKDRKGVLFEGIFIRDTDPQYESVLTQLRGN